MIFLPASAFLDSSSWEESHQLHQQAASYNDYTIVTPPSAAASGGHQGNNNLHQHGSAMAAEGGGGGAAATEAAGGEAMAMRMSERARLARIPQPEAGLKCPRCDSTNTKFCYFNNYSLTQPRHFCRACRRYWTRGGTLRNVPVGGGYRRHAKRAAKSTKPSTAAPAPAAACTMLSSSASPILPPPLQQQYHHRSATTGFDMASLAAWSCFQAPAGMEQQQRITAQSRLHSFPFLHAMDHHIMGPPTAMAMPSMFHLGLQNGGVSSEDGGELFHVKTDEEEYAVRATNNRDATSYYSAGNL